jgi:citrate synthase
LVLMADHELAASTLAVRVAASTWASPAGVVLAGLGALSGPLHGSASAGAYELIAESLAIGPQRAITVRRNAGGRLPGFGHKVYAATDPRAALLLDLLDEVGPARTMRIVHELVDTVHGEIGRAANVDLALAALAHCCAMDARAGEFIMSLARISGWLAHALEEYEQPPLRFRVRAAYAPDPPG